MVCKFPGSTAKRSLDNNGYCVSHKLTETNAYFMEFEKLNEKLDDVLGKMNVLVGSDNSEAAVMDIAAKLGILISKDMIQRCHRVGRRRKKPRSFNVKLKCWSKRMEFIKGKANLRDADWFNISPTVSNEKETIDKTVTESDGNDGGK